MPVRSRRLSIPVLSCLTLAMTAALSGPASAADVDYSPVKINEVQSEGTDTIELVNTGTTAIDLSGLVLKDSTDKDPYTVPAGSVIAPGGYAVFTAFVFGLGKGDSVRLFNGTSLLDTTTWPAETHAATWGRCADGTGPFGVTAPTFGAANACVPDPTKVRINEVRSNGGADFVELINTGSLPVDITGWKAVDADPTHAQVVIAAPGTTIAPGGYYSFETDAETLTGHFGLGGSDSITVFPADGTSVIDTYSWTAHRTPSFGRCPAGTGELVANTTATPGAANSCPLPAGAADIRINEVESDPNDKVELINTGSASVDLSGFVLRDEGNDPFVIATGTTIDAGAFTVIDPTASFKFGKGDSARLFAPGGETLLDATTWPADTHATTWGRCANGTGAFGMMSPSLGSANGCGDPQSVVTINEIESNGDTVGDWVELTNTHTSPIDVSGWKILDNDPTHVATPVVIPAGTTIAPKGFIAIYTEHNQAPGFGLGNVDSATLLLGDGTTVVDTYAWDAHAATTFGRCPDGSGAFTTTTTPTRGAANDCGPATDPEPDPGVPSTTPWPGSPDVRTSDIETTFVQDLSGLVFDPKDPDVLWAAQNKLGTLFKLKRDGQNWIPDTANGWGAGKTPKYPAGGGAPDTEGLTIGPDGFIYASSERDNANNKISRMSVLRYDPSSTATVLPATDEWDLTSKIPAAGANLGLEGITWIPDSFLTAGGFIDQSTGTAYQPSDYPLHGTGLYVVAIEDTGALHAFALDSTGGTSHRIATITSGFPHLADVTFDPERRRLWAVTDDTHEGKTSALELTNGAFRLAEAFDRPASMPNINNEGFALAPQSRCVDGAKEVVWATDGDDGGHSLRSGSISCKPATTPVEPNEPAEPVAPVVPAPVVPAPVDRTAPVVSIGGVTRNQLYTGTAPRARCIATDALSGVASCTLTRRVTPTRTTLTARAVDRAGNVGVATTQYRTLAYVARGATYRGGKFLMHRGDSFRLVGTVKVSGRVHGPVRKGVGATSKRLQNGAASLRIPRHAKVGSTWKIRVKTGSKTYTVKVLVTR